MLTLNRQLQFLEHIAARKDWLGRWWRGRRGLYGRNLTTGRVRDNETQVRENETQVIGRVIRQVRPDEQTTEQRAKNTFSIKQLCVYQSGHHLSHPLHASFQKSAISQPQREDRGPQP